MDEIHPLSVLLADSVAGRFPPADGTVRVVPALPGPTDAVVSFSFHNVVATGLDPVEVARHLPGDDPGAPMSAEFLAWLAGRLGTAAGMIDLVMVAPEVDPGEDLPKLIRRDELVGHPRLARSRQFRTDLRCFADSDDRALLVVGRGLAGREELGIEVRPEFRGSGLGTMLARAAVRVVSPEEPLFAQVSPGNVASIRTFLAAGYRPICSEALFLRPITA